MNRTHRWTRIFCTLALVVFIAGCAGPAPAARPAPTLAAPTQAAARPTATAGQPRATEGAPVYLDAQADTQARAEDLLARMTLEEKIGQMTQVEKDSISPQEVALYSIGSVLSGGGGSPRPNTPEAWVDMIDGFQAQALKTRLGIPIIYGVDAVHGHNNLKGAVIFPHNVGLGAANDPALVEQIGRATAEEMNATGARWNFAPVLAVPQDIRWGRTYEGFGEDTALVTRLGEAYLRGLQHAGATDGLRQPGAALATPKHYIGDGGTKWGTSSNGNYRIDQGDMQVDEATLRALFLPPYKAAIQAGAQSVMVSFSSWNGLKMHAQKRLITDLLKGELGFSGFVVSDWQGIDQLPGDYASDVVTSINAGLDMIMVPYDYKTFITTLTKAVQQGDVSITRVDDAVRRILTVKINMGLFEHPYADTDLLGTIGSADHRALARQAVAKSLVLLQNNGSVLPLAKDSPSIFVGGRAADDIGIQCGGWTMEWQGASGDITPGTSILKAVQGVVDARTRVVYDARGQFPDEKDASGKPAVAAVGIAVVGEMPYAEGQGDQANLSLAATDRALIERMRERSKKLVVVILSGRPLIITDLLPQADAWVAAWLPGTEGQGVTDVLFGDAPFTGRLPYTWPRAMDQLPLENLRLIKDSNPPLFPYGFGLEN